jgi:3-isopropylmalate/(R)-2-methylmalate dehydratase small subunit
MVERKKLKGKAWVFGDIIDADFDICTVEATWDGLQTKKDWGKYCMTGIDPEFPQKVRKGDFLIAGENMGYGYGHNESGFLSIKECGIAAVICESTNRIFFRNAVQAGLPVIELKGIKSKVKEGDELEVDLSLGLVKNLHTSEELYFSPYPDFMLEIIDAGGIYPLVKKMLTKGDIPIYISNSQYGTDK